LAGRALAPAAAHDALLRPAVRQASTNAARVITAVMTVDGNAAGSPAALAVPLPAAPE
jgi:hypothetical protein